MEPPYLSPRPTFAYKQRACSSMCSTHDKLAKGRFSTHSVLLLTLPLALPTTPELITMLFSASYVLVFPLRVSQGASRSSYSSVLSSISLRLAQFATSVTLRKRNKSPTFYSRWQIEIHKNYCWQAHSFQVPALICLVDRYKGRPT